MLLLFLLALANGDTVDGKAWELFGLLNELRADGLLALVDRHLFASIALWIVHLNLVAHGKRDSHRFFVSHMVCLEVVWVFPLLHRIAFIFMLKQSTWLEKQLLYFEWSSPWHHIITYLSQILTFFVLKSGEDKEERIILMKSRALRSLDFIRIILSSSSLLLVGGSAVTTVIYLANLITANLQGLLPLQS